MDETKPKGSRERVALHRARRRELELQAAVGAARLALGLDAGDQALALARFIWAVAGRDGIPEDYARLLEDAAAKLSSRRRR